MGNRFTLLANLVCAFVLSAFVAGCAGPTTPFGAVSFKRSLTSAPADDDDDDNPGQDDDSEVAKNNLKPAAPASSNGTGLTTTTTASSAAVATAATGTAGTSNVATTAASKPPLKVETATGTNTTPTAAGLTVAASTVPPTPAVSAALSATASDANFLRPKVSFTPKRQILHSKTPFSILVEDPQGVPSSYELQVLYNGMDITKRFRWQARESFNGHPATQVKLTMNNLRMLPGRANKVEVVYWHSHNDRPSYGKFEPPHCSAFSRLKIQTTGNFEVPSKLLAELSDESIQSHFNPNFVAGLIAQESAFNSKAVSSAKAIGLTQITPLGEAEVIKTKDAWPRYPNVNKLPSPIVKFKVMTGKINSSNEWRLNPDLSVEGGITYLSYLNDYWRRAANYDSVASHFKNQGDAITQLILASYNSGPARVNSALQNHGRRWLKDDADLHEARKYVSRVMSYCDSFAQQEDDDDQAP